MPSILQKLNFEIVASVSAMVLSIVAIFVAWDQSVVMRAQQHASVWPIVDVDVTLDRNDERNILSIDIKNVGVGPAIIEYAEMSVSGVEVDSYKSLDDHLFVGALRDSVGINASSFIGVIGAGEEQTAIKFTWPRTETYDADFVLLVEKFLAAETDLLSIEACYCSVFERCWRSNSHTQVKPVSVESCPTQEQDIAEMLLSSANEM